jgi:hypothetical protein
MRWASGVTPWAEDRPNGFLDAGQEQTY